MANRVDFVPGSERPVEATDSSSQLEQRLPGGVEAGLVVVGHDERLARAGGERKLVLQRVHSRKVSRIVRVDEDAHAHDDVGRVVDLNGELVFSGIVQHPIDVVVLVDCPH